jgi:hypothetical protein
MTACRVLTRHHMDLRLLEETTVAQPPSAVSNGAPATQAGAPVPQRLQPLC